MKNLQGFVCTAAVLLTLVAPRGAAAAGVETRLADAAMKRDVAAVRALIAKKVDVNAPGSDGYAGAALGGARRRRRDGALLLGAGAKATLANRFGVTPLALAAATATPR